MPWKEEEIEVLLKMWSKFSASQISKVLTRSRNAVIGKIHRLEAQGLVVLNNKVAAAAGKPKPREEKPMDEPPPPSPPPPPPVFLSACDIYELDHTRCHWPLGETYDRATMYCGDWAEDGRPYCYKHCRLAYQSNAYAAE